jgi:hypothetical protein
MSNSTSILTCADDGSVNEYVYVCMYSHRDTGIVDIEEFQILMVGEVLTLD